MNLRGNFGKRCKVQASELFQPTLEGHGSVAAFLISWSTPGGSTALGVPGGEGRREGRALISTEMQTVAAGNQLKHPERCTESRQGSDCLFPPATHERANLSKIIRFTSQHSLVPPTALPSTTALVLVSGLIQQPLDWFSYFNKF